MNIRPLTYLWYRWVRLECAYDMCRLGWMTVTDRQRGATLDGTPHGQWSVNMGWICPTCPPGRPMGICGEAPL
jgi:hypothetical protein